MVQACHASIEAARQSIIPADIEHPHLVVFGVSSEIKLINVTRRLDNLGIKYRTFVESDLNDSLTAIATEPLSGEIRTHFRKYQLLKYDDASSRKAVA